MQSTTKPEPPEADGQPAATWSKPLSKTAMMRALRLHGRRTFDAFSRRAGIREAGNRQTWQLNTATLTAEQRERLRNV